MLNAIEKFKVAILHLNTVELGITEIAKICNIWAFWYVIQLISHLFKI